MRGFDDNRSRSALRRGRPFDRLIGAWSRERLEQLKVFAVRRGKAIGSDDVSATGFVLSIILFYVQPFKLRLWQSWTRD